MVCTDINFNIYLFGIYQNFTKKRTGYVCLMEKRVE